MKKTLTSIRIFGLLAIAFTLTFSACKKDNGNAGITGIWVKTYGGNVDQYTFKNDFTVEHLSIATDSATKQIVGYRYRSTGKYSVKNAELTLYDLVNYTNLQSNFGPINELLPVDGAKNETYTISLSEQKDKLSFYFTCPPNADCVPSPIIYVRQQ